MYPRPVAVLLLRTLVVHAVFEMLMDPEALLVRRRWTRSRKWDNVDDSDFVSYRKYTIRDVKLFPESVQDSEFLRCH